MQLVVKYFLVLMILSAILACGLNLGQTIKPTVTITAPPAGSTFALNQEVTVQSIAVDPQGVHRVELWADGQQVHVQAVAPAATTYTASQPWKPAIPGSHIVEVRAYNAENISSDPAQLIVVVTEAVGEATSVPTTPSTPETALTDTLPTATSDSPGTSLPTVTSTAPPSTVAPTQLPATEAPATPTTKPTTVAPTVEATTPPPPPPTLAPTPHITFWADASTVSCSQPSTTLYWEVGNGLAAYLSSGDRKDHHQVPFQSQEQIAPGTNTRYYLSASGPDGNNEVYQDITVEPPTSPPAPAWTATGQDVGQSGACAYARENLAVNSCGSGPAVFSPDGREVAVLSPQGLYVVSVDGKTVRELITPPGYSPGGDIVWSPWGEYIAYVYNDNGTLKTGVTRNHGTTPSDLWVINPENTTDWPRWTADQRLLVKSGPSAPTANQVYVIWLSQPPTIESTNRCETYELSASAPHQRYYPWGPGKTWVAGSAQGYETDY
jgi:hypothetical protein